MNLKFVNIMDDFLCTTAIASGSNGNCYYVGDEDCSILVDAGVSAKQIKLRLDNLNLDVNKISGIFITHEHSDHVRGISVFSKKFNIPVYITKKTYENCKFKVNAELLNHFEVGDSISLKNFKINSFAKLHDGIDPCSFTINSKNKSIAIITDIGTVCTNVINSIRDCDAIFIESNYDEKMLENSNYPYFLKERISGKYGHISNSEATNLLSAFGSENLQYVFLSHLSGNNNSPDIAHNYFIDNVNFKSNASPKIVMTSRDGEIPLNIIK